MCKIENIVVESVPYQAKTVYYSDGTGRGYVQLDIPGKPRFGFLFFDNSHEQIKTMERAERILASLRASEQP
jgi:hypothetical protein